MSDLTTIGFGEVPFQEAIDYLRRLTPMSAHDFRELSLNAQRDAFSFAEASTATIADKVRAILEAAPVDPVRGNFAERVNQALAQYDISISRFQAETIFDTVMNRAINQGKRTELSDPVIAAAYPFVGVDTAMDSRVRPNHWALDWRRIRTVFRFNDPGWAKMFPPFGYRCRCTIRPFSQAEVDAQQLAVGDLENWLGRSVVVAMPDGSEMPTVIAPDPGFGSGVELAARGAHDHAVIPFNVMAMAQIIIALNCCARKAA